MSQLTIYRHDNPAQHTFDSHDPVLIAQQLSHIGVRFERWQASHNITDDMNQEDIIEAYQTDITRLKAAQGYQTVDVISLAKGNPNAAQLREKFLFEHTHSEDEVRFFVKGQGLFCLHVHEQVFQVLCQQGDLISVPKNTPHWFDMGSDPEFSAIRLFDNQEGWVATSTESEIAKRFPLID
jgi:1,2-dihydroxy-3-keto-5-methylthiopentene dioxygenase